MVIRCCARDCNIILTRSPVNCYSFPADPEQAMRFLRTIKREDLMSVPLDQLIANYLVCYLHVTMVPAPAEAEDSSIYERHAPFQSSDFQVIEQRSLDSTANRSDSSHRYSAFPGGTSEGSYHSVMMATRGFMPSIGMHPGNVNLEPRTSNHYHQVPPEGVTMECTLCKLLFRCLDKFREHMLQYHKEFFCDLCNRTFTSKYYLKSHQEKRCPNRRIR